MNNDSQNSEASEKLAIASPFGPRRSYQLSNFLQPRRDVTGSISSPITQRRAFKKSSSENDDDNDEFSVLYGKNFTLTDNLFAFLTMSPKTVVQKSASAKKQLNYDKIRDLTTVRFLGLLEKIDMWQRIKIVDGISLYRNESEGLTLCAQIGIEDITQEDLDNMVQRLKKASYMTNHPFHQGVVPIEKYDENSTAYHIAFHNVLRKPSDDFVLLSSYAQLKPGCFLVSGHSIKHPSCPKRPAYTRGEILLFGYYIEWSPETKRAYVTYLNQFSNEHLSKGEIDKIIGVECYSMVSSIKGVMG